MAMTYAATEFNTGGAGASDAYWHKFLTFADAAEGDLLFVVGVGENYSDASNYRGISTTVGSTSSWTRPTATPVVDQDCECYGGWATVSSTGSVTVRVILNLVSGSVPMGIGGWLIPAGEWDEEATPTLGYASGGDADGQISLSPGATSTVLYMGADNVATDPGTSNTPSGATNHTTYDGTGYSVAARSWTGQEAGTRNYGPSGLSGCDYAMLALVVEEGAAVTEVTATAVAAPAAVPQSGWATRDSLIVMGGASKSGTWS